MSELHPRYPLATEPATSKKGLPMIRAARYAYVALAWAFVAGILLQVVFIGMGPFVKPQNFDLHVNFGWLLHLGPLLILVAAAPEWRRPFRSSLDVKRRGR